MSIETGAHWQKHYGKKLLNPLKLIRDHHDELIYNRPIKTFLIRTLGENQGRSLDIGCGMFPDMYWPNTNNVVFTDWQPYILTQSPRKVLADGNNLPFPGSSFDTVLSKQVINYISDEDRFLEEMVRVTKNSGRIVLIGIKFTGIAEDGSHSFDVKKARDILTRLSITNIEETAIYDSPQMMVSKKIANIQLIALVGTKNKKRHHRR